MTRKKEKKERKRKRKRSLDGQVATDAVTYSSSNRAEVWGRSAKRMSCGAAALMNKKGRDQRSERVRTRNSNSLSVTSGVPQGYGLSHTLATIRSHVKQQQLHAPQPLGVLHFHNPSSGYATSLQHSLPASFHARETTVWPFKVAVHCRISCHTRGNSVT